jgi:hypothetical protein
MSIKHYRDVSRLLAATGVVRAYMKALSNNDNSKNQIYLGPSFDALQLLPFGEIVEGNIGLKQNLKASVNFFWLSESGNIERAQHAQLILYPQYPEVRLSGFLRGCEQAPSQYLQPIQKEQRSSSEGRVLILGITADARIIGYLAVPGTELAQSIEAELSQDDTGKIFIDFPIDNTSALSRKLILISRLKEIVRLGWHRSQRRRSDGQIIYYNAPNAGGYTLESLFGIIPNGISEPDFMGWELKAYSGSRITLMTPEPDAGYYGENGAEAFIRKYGETTDADTIRFTGLHRANKKNEKTGLTLSAIDYDASRKRFTSIRGGLALLGGSGEMVAGWSFKRLIAHWARKHALAAYIKYEKSQFDGNVHYRYLAPVHFGEGTDFSQFMTAIIDGSVYYDPAPTLKGVSSLHPHVKARSQFRINSTNLKVLYNSFTEVALE